VFAIGDVAMMQQVGFDNGHPQIAPVAIQQATMLAKNIVNLNTQQDLGKFNYYDKV
jgi:NADH dehydrogenase